eukprot:8225-Eustigmatos_ZCMA.PRE.1
MVLRAGPFDREMNPPMGAWRDGLCSCFNNIWPSCLLSTFLPYVALDEIAMRSKAVKWLMA